MSDVTSCLHSVRANGHHLTLIERRGQAPGAATWLIAFRQSQALQLCAAGRLEDAKVVPTADELQQLCARGVLLTCSYRARLVVLSQWLAALWCRKTAAAIERAVALLEANHNNKKRAHSSDANGHTNGKRPRSYDHGYPDLGDSNWQAGVSLEPPASSEADTLPPGSQCTVKMLVGSQLCAPPPAVPAVSAAGSSPVAAADPTMAPSV